LIPWIIAFKAVKSVLLLALGVALLAAVGKDPVGLVFQIAYTIHLPGTSAVFERLLRAATRATPRKELAGALVALAYSALMGGEGVALYLRKPWAPWFTIGATSSLLPIEVIEIIREPHVSRVVILIVNVAVVIYLWDRRGEFAPDARTGS
jgi:uncharacterized membrane protein (DUF2068 family)